MNTLMGDRHYYPIYAAAEHHGLPIALAPQLGRRDLRARRPRSRADVPTYYVEWHAALTQIFQANVISLVCHGVFERFPGLKVVIAEGGIAWLPDVMWRLDKNWEALRDEVPWVKRQPSEYILDHVRFTTQPFLEPRKREHLQAMLDIVDAERTLLFSSDYPHWDFDDPMRALTRVCPEPMREADPRRQRGRALRRSSGLDGDRHRPHVVCAARRAPAGQPPIVEIDGRSIGVFNVGGDLYAIRNPCPHRGAPLCEGTIGGTMLPSDPHTYVYGLEDRLLRCPWHGWEIELATGRPRWNDRPGRARIYRSRSRTDRSSCDCDRADPLAEPTQSDDACRRHRRRDPGSDHPR